MRHVTHHFLLALSLLCVLAAPFLARPAEAQQRVFRSNGFFTLGTETELSASITFADVDADGDLDLVVANGRHWAQQNRLYLNNGEGYYRLSRDIGDERATSYAAPLADFDGDGDLDIAVGNDRVRNLILWNDGQGHYQAGPTFGGIESTRGITLADLEPRQG